MPLSSKPGTKLSSLSSKLSSKIPKLIHQTWKSELSLPNSFKKNQAGFKKLHPDWEYIFWDDQKILQFVRSNFNQLLTMFNAFPHPVMQIDLFRYLALYKLGGVYVDMDYVFLSSLNPIIKNRSLLLTLEPDEHKKNPQAHLIRGLPYIVSNAIMGSSANHPFWLIVIKNLKKYYPEPNILDATGPFMLTKTYIDYSKKKPLDLVPAKVLNPVPHLAKPKSYLTKKTIAYHEWASSWWGRKKLDKNLLDWLWERWAFLNDIVYGLIIKIIIKNNFFLIPVFLLRSQEYYSLTNKLIRNLIQKNIALKNKLIINKLIINKLIIYNKPWGIRFKFLAFTPEKLFHPISFKKTNKKKLAALAALVLSNKENLKDLQAQTFTDYEIVIINPKMNQDDKQNLVNQLKEDYGYFIYKEKAEVWSKDFLASLTNLASLIPKLGKGVEKWVGKSFNNKTNSPPILTLLRHTLVCPTTARRGYSQFSIDLSKNSLIPTSLLKSFTITSTTFQSQLKKSFILALDKPDMCYKNINLTDKNDSAEWSKASKYFYL